MSTQTGELQIDAVEGNQVRGWFRSVYEKNVHTPSRGFAARVLFEAFEQISMKVDEGELLAHVESCTFTAPNTPSTNFTITLTGDALVKDVAARLQGYWETYYLG